jgi:hypothetical protein
MKATLLTLLGISALFLGGCATDEDPTSRPEVRFGNDLPREAGNEQPASPATDKERNVW